VQVETSLRSGCLLNPFEAMSLALGAGKGMETLYSIARKVSFEHGGDEDEVLAHLGERFPTFAG